MEGKLTAKVICIAGPTASGKSARAVEEALAEGGEVISVDSRQVYRGLDIGTEKVTREEMRGVPHHLIDIREPVEPYSAGDFALDAARLIEEIAARGKLPILAGGTHFYFDALLSGLPGGTPPNEALRAELAALPTEELAARVAAADPRRAGELDPKNRRRLIRALEIVAAQGSVPPRPRAAADYQVEWIVIDPPLPALRERIDARLAAALERGLVDEVARVRAAVGDARLNELGLEYRIVGEYLRGERTRESLFPALAAKLGQLARRQKAWLRKLAATAAAA
ncbi:MAG: tRNA (adenosine(37)-N6)-dimethylallyltransferase MiaA [Patescibacteria group bacterium]|nr:tRNA (adenosine(37)-N6)-dimethylallyltransferase MiaA [Patescibacteria group bacterium]MDE1944917.1 tRNA (adenosine(37)-N6)-dimethylallyltransferase MiaA [Patescibacteria group bacterium]MDE2057438.1 tRNA (adenosine(37)-N6)-dimethylallyltransferase MiaA [Patescibacteria group bacterium]